MSSLSPPNKRRKIIKACAFVGPPPKELTAVETLRFVFRNFKNLKQKNGKCLKTDPLMAHNHLWKICMYPQGKEYDGDGFVSCFLQCMDASKDNPVEARSEFHVPFVNLSRTLNYTFTESTPMYAYPKMGRHSHVVENSLDSEGSLVIDIDIQVYVEKKSVWYPKKKETYSSLGRQLFESDLESDIIFVVGGEQEKIHAHRFILVHRAPTLYEFIKDLQHGEEFELPDIGVSTFSILLEYIYTGDIPEGFFKITSQVVVEFAKDLLLAANRFGLIYLKLYIESEIVAKLLTVDNAAEWLPIADAQICPLLKEECMKIFLKDRSQFKASSGWKQIQESSHLLEELLDFTDSSTTSAVVVAGTTNLADNNGRDYDNMSVRMLREELESKDMDLDGTKSMLIQRLKDFYDQQQRQQSPSTAAAASVDTD